MEVILVYLNFLPEIGMSTLKRRIGIENKLKMGSFVNDVWL
jgi:hypothetical protein